MSPSTIDYWKLSFIIPLISELHIELYMSELRLTVILEHVANISSLMIYVHEICTRKDETEGLIWHICGNSPSNRISIWPNCHTWYVTDRKSGDRARNIGVTRSLKHRYSLSWDPPKRSIQNQSCPQQRKPECAIARAYRGAKYINEYWLSFKDQFTLLHNSLLRYFPQP